MKSAKAARLSSDVVGSSTTPIRRVRDRLQRRRLMDLEPLTDTIGEGQFAWTTHRPRHRTVGGKKSRGRSRSPPASSPSNPVGPGPHVRCVGRRAALHRNNSKNMTPCELLIGSELPECVSLQQADKSRCNSCAQWTGQDRSALHAGYESQLGKRRSRRHHALA